MDATHFAILSGLAAGIGWGFSGFFDAKAAKHVGAIAASLLINGIVAVGYAILYILFLSRGHAITAAGVWYAIASGMVITIGALSYFRGLSLGPVSLVSPLSASYPLVTTIVAVVFFGTHLRMPQILGILLVICGVMAASGIADVKNHRTATIAYGPFLALCAALTWGIGYALAYQAIARLGWQLASLIEFGSMAVAFGLFIPCIRTDQPMTWRDIRQGIRNRYILLSSSFSLAAALTLNLGLSQEQSSGAIVATLSACYPVLTVLMARHFFNEVVEIIPLAGAFASIAGVVLLTLH